MIHFRAVREPEVLGRGVPTDEQQVRIRALKAEGVTNRALAERFGCSPPTIHRILKSQETADPLPRRRKYILDRDHGLVWRCCAPGCKVSRNGLRAIQRHWKICHARHP